MIHERRTKVNHSFPFGCNRQWCDSYIGFLKYICANKPTHTRTQKREREKPTCKIRNKRNQTSSVIALKLKKEQSTGNLHVEPIHQRYHSNRQPHLDFLCHMIHLLPFAAHLRFRCRKKQTGKTAKTNNKNDGNQMQTNTFKKRKRKNENENEMKLYWNHRAIHLARRTIDAQFVCN